MIIKPELVKKIKEYFSLNIYETKVWLALLGKGVATAGEIAEISNVPRSRTYDVLESLEKRGFAIAKLGKPVKYIHKVDFCRQYGFCLLPWYVFIPGSFKNRKNISRTRHCSSFCSVYYSTSKLHD